MGAPTTVTDALTLSPKDKASADGLATSVYNTGASAVTTTVKTAGDGAKVVTDAFSSFSENWKKKGFFPAVGDLFSGAWEGLMGFLGMTGNAETDKKGLNVGSLLGGGIGGGLGWMIGQAFGGGWLGTIFGLAAGAVGLIIGAQQGDKYINGWLGRPVRGTRESNAQAQSQAIAAAPGQSQQQDVAASASSIDWGQVHNAYVDNLRQQQGSAQAFSNVSSVSYSPQPSNTGFVPAPTPVGLAANGTSLAASGQPIGWRIGG